MLTLLLLTVLLLLSTCKNRLPNSTGLVFCFFFFTLLRNTFFGWEGHTRVHTLILTSIQKEFIDLEYFINWFPYLSKGPFGIRSKTKVYFIKIIKIIRVMKE